VLSQSSSQSRPLPQCQRLSSSDFSERQAPRTATAHGAGTTQPRVEVVIAKCSAAQGNSKTPGAHPISRQYPEPAAQQPSACPFSSCTPYFSPASSPHLFHSSPRIPTNELEGPNQDRCAGMDLACYLRGRTSLTNSPDRHRKLLSNGSISYVALKRDLSSFPRHSRRLPLVWGQHC
jgi:hypothetical protein